MSLTRKSDGTTVVEIGGEERYEIAPDGRYGYRVLREVTGYALSRKTKEIDRGKMTIKQALGLVGLA